MNLLEKHSSIRTKADLAQFIGALKEDFKSNPNAWENTNLESFLDAMQAWVEVMENYYKNTGKEMPSQPTWQTFADILMAARIYE